MKNKVSIDYPYYFSLNVLYQAGNRGDNRHVATNVAKTAGGMAGLTTGAAVGAAVGSIVPVFGTVVGGFVGGVVGGHIGGKGAEVITDMACDATNADWRCQKCMDWNEKDFTHLENDYVEVGRTEIKWDNLNPVFENKVSISYNTFEK